MQVLFLFIFICYGISNMVVYSNGPFYVFKHLRDITNRIHPKLGELFSCMMCFPAWVGGLLSLINIMLVSYFPFTPMNELSFEYLDISDNSLISYAIIVICDCAIASGASWVIHNIEEYFERGNIKQGMSLELNEIKKTENEVKSLEIKSEVFKNKFADELLSGLGVEIKKELANPTKPSKFQIFKFKLNRIMQKIVLKQTNG